MGYGRGRSQTKVLVPFFKNFASLSLEDLKKIQISKQKYDENLKIYNQARSEVTSYNSKLEAEYNKSRDVIQNWWVTKRKPAEDKVSSAKRSLMYREIGAWDKLGIKSGFFGDEPIFYEGMKLKNNADTYAEIRRYEEAKSILDEVLASKPHNPFERAMPSYQQLPDAPRQDQPFTIAGAKVRIDLGILDLVQIKALICQREAERERDKEALNQLKARIAANESETRQQAKKYQTDFRVQKKIVAECPYCGGSLNESSSHLDHIYPVSKGGHSVKRNLVFVCATCNLKKKNHTLRTFLLVAGFQERTVYERLERLGKDF